MTMTVDPQKLLVGDFVTFHWAGITRIDHSLSRPVEVKYPSGATGWVHFADIATHTPVPKPVKVGDWVNVPGQNDPYQVRAIDEGVAWLKNRRGRTWMPLGTLTPCEAP